MQNSATATSVGSAGAASAVRHWRTEDWIAVVLGFLVITTVLVLFQWKLFDLGNVVPTFRWTTDGQIASLTQGWSASLEKIERDATARKQTGLAELSAGLRTALEGKDRRAIDNAAGKLALAHG